MQKPWYCEAQDQRLASRTCKSIKDGIRKHMKLKDISETAALNDLLANVLGLNKNKF